MPYHMPAFLHKGNQLRGGAASMWDIQAGPLWGLPVLVCHSMQHFLQCDKPSLDPHAVLSAGLQLQLSLAQAITSSAYNSFRSDTGVSQLSQL